MVKVIGIHFRFFSLTYETCKGALDLLCGFIYLMAFNVYLNNLRAIKIHR